MIPAALAIARVKLVLELRRREVIFAMLLFIAATIVIVHFALSGDTGAGSRAAAGMLWAAVVFTAVLGLLRTFAAEQEEGHWMPCCWHRSIAPQSGLVLLSPSLVFSLS